MSAPGGDYLVLQRENSAVVIDTPIAATALTATLKFAGRANYTIFIQFIAMVYTTHVAGKVVTVQDDAGSPVVVGTIVDQAAGAGVPDSVYQDFGPHGIPLTEGQGIAIVANTGGAGSVGRLHIEGYRRLTSTINLTTASNAS